MLMIDLAESDKRSYQLVQADHFLLSVVAEQLGDQTGSRLECILCGDTKPEYSPLEAWERKVIRDIAHDMGRESPV